LPNTSRNRSKALGKAARNEQKLVATIRGGKPIGNDSTLGSKTRKQNRRGKYLLDQRGPDYDQSWNDAMNRISEQYGRGTTYHGKGIGDTTLVMKGGSAKSTNKKKKITSNKRGLPCRRKIQERLRIKGRSRSEEKGAYYPKGE